MQGQKEQGRVSVDVSVLFSSYIDIIKRIFFIFIYICNIINGQETNKLQLVLSGLFIY